MVIWCSSNRKLISSILYSLIRIVHHITLRSNKKIIIIMYIYGIRNSSRWRKKGTKKCFYKEIKLEANLDTCKFARQNTQGRPSQYVFSAFLTPRIKGDLDAPFTGFKWIMGIMRFRDPVLFPPPTTVGILLNWG